MPANSAEDHVQLSQSSIYDARYQQTGYDRRSAVRVLTAESTILSRAMRRIESVTSPGERISLIDFGYGTGRVINEFVVEKLRGSSWGHDLTVLAYDISAVGLEKAARTLVADHGFQSTSRTWRTEPAGGYVAGSLTAGSTGRRVTVILVHGDENGSSEQMQQLLLAANDGEPATLTTSWYSGLGHIQQKAMRGRYFAALGELTQPRGEMILSVAATGDVVDEQAEWSQRRRTGSLDGHPVTEPGDVMYETELGRLNFWHVFGTDLNEHMQAVTGPQQRWWIEAIRFPDSEFATQAAEQRNYEQVCRFNADMRGRRWQDADFARLHTVAAVRSGSSDD